MLRRLLARRGAHRDSQLVSRSHGVKTSVLDVCECATHPPCAAGRRCGAKKPSPAPLFPVYVTSTRSPRIRRGPHLRFHCRRRVSHLRFHRARHGGGGGASSDGGNTLMMPTWHRLVAARITVPGRPWRQLQRRGCLREARGPLTLVNRGPPGACLPSEGESCAVPF